MVRLSVGLSRMEAALEAAEAVRLAMRCWKKEDGCGIYKDKKKPCIPS